MEGELERDLDGVESGGREAGDIGVDERRNAHRLGCYRKHAHRDHRARHRVAERRCADGESRGARARKSRREHKRAGDRDNERGGGRGDRNAVQRRPQKRREIRKRGVPGERCDRDAETERYRRHAPKRGERARDRIGEWVFVPGATCYTEARGLFGGTAQRVVLPSARAFPVSEDLGQDGILFALAATALHALSGGDPPELIVGHGVLGRLLARLTIASGAPPPVVWDNNAARRSGAVGYHVMAPKDDDRHDYGAIYDASGHADGLDALIGRLGKRGEIVLAGFYANRLSFAFAPAFRAEARLR